MLRNYILVAIRNILRQKGYAIINISGLREIRIISLSGRVLTIVPCEDRQGTYRLALPEVTVSGQATVKAAGQTPGTLLLQLRFDDRVVTKKIIRSTK